MSWLVSHGVQPDTVNDLRSGGAERDRTVDPLLAKQVLSQLSYSPIANYQRSGELTAKLVGLGRFELPTSPLSGVRSNQLSYRPQFESQSESHSRAKISSSIQKGFEDKVERALELRPR